MHWRDPAIVFKEGTICGAYYITPDLAKELKEYVEEYITIKKIHSNVDGYLHGFIDTKTRLSGHIYDPKHDNRSPVYQCMHEASYQFIDEKIGTTIKHLTLEEES